MEGEDGVKAERVTNFLTVPGEVEKVRTTALGRLEQDLNQWTADHPVRVHHLPRLVPLHLHDPTPPLPHRLLLPRLQLLAQHLLPLSTAVPPPIAQVRPHQDARSRRDAVRAASHDGREQDVSQRAWTGDAQVVRDLQRPRGALLLFSIPANSSSRDDGRLRTVSAAPSDKIFRTPSSHARPSGVAPTVPTLTFAPSLCLVSISPTSVRSSLLSLRTR